jgi:hypothetical protein
MVLLAIKVSRYELLSSYGDNGMKITLHNSKCASWKKRVTEEYRKTELLLICVFYILNKRHLLKDRKRN